MTRTLAAIALTASLAVPAQASLLTHDSIASFSSITVSQGLRGNGTPVTPGRSNIGNMFDNNETTRFYSMGLGGSLTLTIASTDAPFGRRIVDGAVIERTNVGGGYPEAVQVFLGVNGGSFVLLGELRNRDIGVGVVNEAGAPGLLTYTGAAGNGETARSLFSITNITGNFNSIRFLDRSLNRGPDRDGFDIAELELRSAALLPPGDGPGPAVVPTPMALGLFGVGEENPSPGRPRGSPARRPHRAHNQLKRKEYPVLASRAPACHTSAPSLGDIAWPPISSPAAAASSARICAWR
jgi:hypothetical protein